MLHKYSVVPEPLLRSLKAQIFQALAHPTRVALVDALAWGERTAEDLIEHLGLEATDAAHHLSILHAREIVVMRRVGKHYCYMLRDPALTDVLDQLCRYADSHVTCTLDGAGRSHRPVAP